MVARIVTKHLAGVEDLLLGSGSVEQERAGDLYPITKLSTVWAANSIAELEGVDTQKFTKAVVGSALYYWTGTEWKTNYSAELESLRRSYAEAGYNVVGTFQAGFTYVNANDVGIDEATGKGYTGPTGLVVAGTDPASGWFVDVSSSLLRAAALAGIYRDWKANLAERGITLVAGSFEEGAATTKPNDAVMHYATGTPYLLKSGANASIPAGDTPNSDWATVRLIEPLPIKVGSKVAHRCLTPENTILALGSCRRSGFDAVETDAKQSADGVWYIFHDDAVDNLTNGTGTFSALSSSYINTLRFDSLSGGKYAAEPIPLVTDFLKAALIKGLTVYLEIKSYLSYADIAGLVTTVEGFNAGASIVICSMDIAVLRHIRFTLNSDVPLQYVYEGTDYTGAINAALSLQRISFSYFNNYVRQYPAVVGACARAGISLFAWTILNKKTADQCSRIGATNIVSDIVL